MRDTTGWLQEHEAAVRCGTVQTPAPEIICQRLMIEKWIIAPERQLETILALLGAMTSARVAADLGQDRHDVPDETGLVLLLLAADADGHNYRLAGDRQLQLAVAVRYGTDETAGRDSHKPVGHPNLGRAREVHLFAAFEMAGEQQLAIIVRVLQSEGCWLGLNAD